MKEDGFIVEIKDGSIAVFFSNFGLKGEVLMELTDDTIVKSEYKTLTATVMQSPAYIGEPINEAAQFKGIGASCQD